MINLVFNNKSIYALSKDQNNQQKTFVMQINIKEKFSDYLKKNSRLKIAGDIIFYLLIILLIIPTTRREVISNIKRITLMKPSVKEAPVMSALSEDDYSFRFENTDGAILSLSDFRGEVLFVNFWATWCPPCRAEMPSIQKLYDEYRDKVKFLMITGEEKEPVHRYIEKYNYNFPVLFQRTSLPPSFSVSAIPHTFIISRDGRILLSKTGAAKWDSKEFKDFLDRQVNL